jgi:Collagen triple helix repeat (20 copies)
MRRRFNYANVTATLALVFAMSGGALAAKHYLINSTKQINPKVLKALRGKTGKEGPRGATGATGVTGATGNTGATGKEGALGKEGSAGPKGEKGEKGTTGEQGEPGEEGKEGAYPTVLPSGTTETGDWGGGNTAGGGGAEYRTVSSFPIPLPAALEASHVIYVTGTSATHCAGVGQAEAGYLCVYQKLLENAKTPESSSIFNADEGGKLAGVGVHGFEITLSSEKAGLTTVSGTYAVTAP